MEQSWMLFAGTGILFTMAFSLLLFIIIYQQRIQNKEKENQQLKMLLQSSEMDYLTKTQELLETERKKISQDIHHHLGSSLAVLKQSWGRYQLGKNSVDDTQLITKIINETIAETKKVSNALYGLGKIGNLETMVQQLAFNIEKFTEVRFEHQINLPNDLSSTVRIDVFRMIQEMVSNTLKYAKASKIFVEIDQPSSGQLSILYHDDGRGFDTKIVVKGMGLDSLELKAYDYNGSFEVESGSRGTTFAILLQV